MHEAHGGGTGQPPQEAVKISKGEVLAACAGAAAVSLAVHFVARRKVTEEVARGISQIDERFARERGRISIIGPRAQVSLRTSIKRELQARGLEPGTVQNLVVGATSSYRALTAMQRALR